MHSNNKPRLSAEVLRLDEHKRAAVQYQPATAIVLVDGPNVADALDALGQRIGIAE